MKISGNFGIICVAVALGAGVVGVPGTARAYECQTTAGAFEPAGRVNVPTDTLIWGVRASETRFLGPTGEVIAVDQRDLPLRDGLFPVLVPRTELEPNARYTLEVIRGVTERASVYEFQTGDGPTSAPPERPVLLRSEPSVAHGLGFGGPTRHVDLEFGHEGILIGNTGNLAIESVDDLLIDPPLPRQPTVAPVLEWLTAATTFSVGFGMCATWPEPRDEATGQFGVLDLAGNFSGWVEAPLVLPSRQEAQAQYDVDKEEARLHNVQTSRPDACSMQPSSPGGSGVSLLALALGLALAVTRRASTSRTR